MRIVFVLLAFIIFSCDTASNLGVSNNYFIKYYGNDGNQTGVDLVYTTDGDFYLLGTTDSKDNGKQIYLVKANQNGDLVWEKTFGGKNDEEARDLLLTTDGRLVVLANTTTSVGNRDVFLATLSLDGTLVNSTIYGFPKKIDDNTFPDEDANSVTQTNDGYLVAGSTNNLDVKIGGSQGPLDVLDAMQLRFYSNLQVYPEVWQQAVGYNNSTEVAHKIIQNTDGNFYLFGFTNKVLPGATSGSGEDYNFWVTLLGPTGLPASAELFPGSEFSPPTNEILTSVIQTPPESGVGFFLSGQSYNQTTGVSDLYCVKLQKSLAFKAQDYVFKKVASVDLKTPFDVRSNPIPQKVSSSAAQSTGYYILANEKRSTKSNWYLTKIDNNGTPQWLNPVIFGGDNDDTIGKILDLPNGKIAMVGTMEIGDKVPEKKMTFIKVNSSGKFAD